MHRCASKNQPSNDHSGPASADPQNLKFGMLAVQRRIVDDEADLHMLQHPRYATGFAHSAVTVPAPGR